MNSINHQIRLAARPSGLPKPPGWNLTTEPVPAPRTGQFVVAVSYLSIDPAMRRWIDADLGAGRQRLLRLSRRRAGLSEASAAEPGLPQRRLCHPAPEAEGVTGRYFANRKPKTSNKASYDTAAAARLWQVSTDLADLTTDA